ncbi:MAG: glutamate--tRNA ligase [Candidatus Thermoplasmatota archaeon]|nr:glutamate--tRNA ligase [Candidatus Thermoplasmatota archaeon]MCL5963702.1 glutamate--tRNA ligase [Candidatus Thermoplasmatota archaeon]
MNDISEIEKRAFFHALRNRLEHNHVANAKAVMGKIIQEFPDMKFNIKLAMQISSEITEKVNKLNSEGFDKAISGIGEDKFKREHESRKNVLSPIDIPNKPPVFRMAPYPSGSLHIGNSRMIILNDEYSKKYNGKLLLVMDDTIGSEEKVPLLESYDMILKDLKWMNVEYSNIFYKSDRLELFYKWGRTVIEKGSAYVCFCTSEILRSKREHGVECEHRNYKINENLKLWDKMLNNEYKAGEAIVRLKSSMKDPNPAFRDRVIFRISDREHPRIGKKYRVWPLLEFSWAIDDVALGVTHVIRGKDLVIEDEMEKYIWKILGWNGPEFIHYGMLRIAEAKLSKSKSMKEVKSGEYLGWDDPRTWSLSSLRRRGIKPEAIRDFVLSFGTSLADIEVPAENLYSENRKLIDSITPRYMYAENGAKCRIIDLPEKKEISAPLYPDDPKKETKILYGEESVILPSEDIEMHRGEIIRLKDFCNVKIATDRNCNDLFFESWENKKIPRIQWVNEKRALECRILQTDGTIKKGYVENEILRESEGNMAQFERYGFVRIDKIEKDNIYCWYSHP